jgi:hypothetical protein
MRGGAPMAGSGNFARGNAGTFGGGMASREGSFGREGSFDRGRELTERGREFGRDHNRFDRDRRFRTFAFGYPDYYSDYDYDYSYDNGCYQWRQMPTRLGWRWQRVWVCGY